MKRKHEDSYWYFCYDIYKEEDLYVCSIKIKEIIIGISIDSYEKAIEDATFKLLNISDLPDKQHNTSELLDNVICIFKREFIDYNKCLIDHIFS